jgi:hypothetical protein
MSHGKRETPQLAPGACLRARVDLVPVTHFSTPAQRRALFLDRRYLQGRVSAAVASETEPAWSPVGAFMTSHAATPEPMTDDQRLGTANDFVSRRTVNASNPFSKSPTPQASPRGGITGTPQPAPRKFNAVSVDFRDDSAFNYRQIHVADPLRVLSEYQRAAARQQAGVDALLQSENRRARDLVRTSSRLEVQAGARAQVTASLEAILNARVPSRSNARSRSSHSRSRPTGGAEGGGGRPALLEPPIPSPLLPPLRPMGTLPAGTPNRNRKLPTRESSSSTTQPTPASPHLTPTASKTLHRRGGGGKSILKQMPSIDPLETARKRADRPRPKPRPISPSNFMPDWRERLHRHVYPNRLATPEIQEARPPRTVPVWVPDATLITLLQQFDRIDETASGVVTIRDVVTYHRHHGWPLPHNEANAVRDHRAAERRQHEPGQVPMLLAAAAGREVAV